MHPPQKMAKIASKPGANEDSTRSLQTSKRHKATAPAGPSRRAAGTDDLFGREACLDEPDESEESNSEMSQCKTAASGQRRRKLRKIAPTARTDSSSKVEEEVSRGKKTPAAGHCARRGTAKSRVQHRDGSSEDEDNSVRNAKRSAKSQSTGRRKISTVEADSRHGSDDVEWSTEDETKLRKSESNDVSLWNRTHRKYGVRPPDLLPNGTQQHSEALCRLSCDCLSSQSAGFKTFGDTTSDSRSRRDETPMNWPTNFCADFNGILCLPVFENDARLVTYALECALHARSGTAGVRQRPSAGFLTKARNQKLMDAVSDVLLDGSAIHASKVKPLEKIFNDILGPAVPLHLKFLDCLMTVVPNQGLPRGSHSKVTTGVASKDIKAITKAWNMYAGLKENKKYGLLAASEYKKLDGTKGEPLEVILQRKKQWILEYRRSCNSEGSDAGESDSGIAPGSSERSFLKDADMQTGTSSRSSSRDLPRRSSLLPFPLPLPHNRLPESDHEADGDDEEREEVEEDEEEDEEKDGKSDNEDSERATPGPPSRQIYMTISSSSDSNSDSGSDELDQLAAQPQSTTEPTAAASSTASAAELERSGQPQERSKSFQPSTAAPDGVTAQPTTNVRTENSKPLSLVGAPWTSTMAVSAKEIGHRQRRTDFDFERRPKASRRVTISERTTGTPRSR